MELHFCFSSVAHFLFHWGSQVFSHRKAGCASWILEHSLDSNGLVSKSARLLIGCVTLGKLMSFSMQVQSGGNSIYIRSGLLWGWRRQCVVDDSTLYMLVLSLAVFFGFVYPFPEATSEVYLYDSSLNCFSQFYWHQMCLSSHNPY